MTFSYAGTAGTAAISTALDKIRMEISDTDPAAALFQDEEIQVKIDERSLVTTAGTAVDVGQAAADLCDILATRFAGQYDFSTDGQSFSRGQRSAFYATRAQDLRRRSGNSSVPLISSVTAAIDDAIVGG